MTAENGSASLRRRLAFAGNSSHFFDGIFCSRPMARFSRIGRRVQVARIPDHASKIAYDLFESLRSGRMMPDIGNVDLALLHADEPMPQHPRYLSYWHDPALDTTVGMIVGVDLIRHGGKYYVLELNHGPSIYQRRREMYKIPFDPIFSTIFDAARAHGFRQIVPIAFQWEPIYLEEFERASREWGIPIVPYNCPLQLPPCPNRMVALPEPLDARTLYVVHSGIFTPAFRYLDNKWYTSKWLGEAIRNEMGPDTLVALPATYDRFVFPIEEHGPRWPNLVVKLSASARSNHVVAARFESDGEAREALGVERDDAVPKRFRAGFLSNLLFYGRDRVLYQEYVPPDLDARGHAQMLRLHLFVSPLRTMFLSAHMRISRKPVPDRAPHGIIGTDDAYVFNNADYAFLSPDIERDMHSVAADLGRAMQQALVRKFETGPPQAQANIPAGSTAAMR
jgi:hypothetical protein